MQTILNNINAGHLHAKIGIVISDHPDAKVLKIAAAAGIPAVCIEPKNFATNKNLRQRSLQKLLTMRCN